MQANASSMRKHYLFLDGVRFLSALWVVFSHLGAPPIHLLAIGTVIEKPVSILQTCMALTFNGTAGVIVFFVISGFCIHFPYEMGKNLVTADFYRARAIRIGLPCIIALLLSLMVPGGLARMHLLWTVYCEAAYYLAYPAILLGIRAGLLKYMLAASFLAAFVLNAFPDQQNGLFWANEFPFYILRGLPIWLLGCLVAVCLRNGNIGVGSAVSCWVLRVSVFLSSGFTLIAHFHSNFHYENSMMPFGVLAALWLLAEFRQHGGQWIFEKLSSLGRATFSIYLMHALSPNILSLAGIEFTPEKNWLIGIATVAALSVAFYFLVEAPAHRLAQHRKKVLASNSPTLPLS